MKKLILTLMGMLCCYTVSFSQQKTIFNFDKTVALTNANASQKELLQSALEIRENAITTDSINSKESKSLINRNFVTKFKNTFNEEQQLKVFESQISLDYVDKKTNEKYLKLIGKYNFPTDYRNVLREEIEKYEYEKALIKEQFLYNELKRESKWKGLNKSFESWRKKETSVLERAYKQWNKLSKFNLDNRFEANYIEYHFYVFHSENESSTTLQNKITELVADSTLADLIVEIATNEANHVISKCSDLKELEENEQKLAENNLADHLKNILSERLEKRSGIFLKRNSDRYCSFAYNTLVAKQNHLDSVQKIRKDRTFLLKAIAIGLDSITAQEIVLLIKKRADDLKSLKEQKKAAEEMSELFESTDVKTKTEIKREFAKQLSEIIDKKQFAELFGSVFTKNVETQFSTKIEELKTTYTLKDKQLEEISELVKTFYFNKEITAAYYAFDKKLKKQKQSALRFTFEKEYKTLMESYNLKVKPGFKVNNRTYLWDN